MASGPTPANVRAIRYLQRQGYSARQIERELGIGGSGRLIKYAAESKPAANLTAPLQALASRVRGEREAPPPPVERRRTRSGKQARTRRKVITTAEGNEQLAVRSPRSVTLRRLLVDAASWGGRVQAIVTWAGVRKYSPPIWFRPGEVPLWEHGGWDADTLLAVLDHSGMSAESVWLGLCLAKPGVEAIERPMLDLQVTIV